jgi:hypothetical protein
LQFFIESSNLREFLEHESQSWTIKQGLVGILSFELGLELLNLRKDLRDRLESLDLSVSLDKALSREVIDDFLLLGQDSSNNSFMQVGNPFISPGDFGLFSSFHGELEGNPNAVSSLPMFKRPNLHEVGLRVRTNLVKSQVPFTVLGVSLKSSSIHLGLVKDILVIKQNIVRLEGKCLQLDVFAEALENLFNGVVKDEFLDIHHFLETSRWYGHGLFHIFLHSDDVMDMVLMVESFQNVPLSHSV